MAKPIIPGAGETVEFLSETIRQRILERIDEVGVDKSKLVTKAAGQTKSVLKKGQPDLYRGIQRLNKQLKSLRRGLGGLLTSDPDAIVNPKTGETWGGLVHDLVDKNVKGPELAKKLSSFGDFVYTDSPVNPGKVGHHRTALNILRDVLKDKPFDYRKKFKEIVQSAGYQIGEEYIDFIDPAAHQKFSVKVGGVLADRLGYTKKGDVPQSLVDALSNRYAHALQFGSTGGFEVPADFLKADVDPEKLFAFSQPYLDAAQRGADSAQELETILTKGQWESAEELTELVNKVKVRDTTDLLDHTGKPLMDRMGKSKVISNLPEGITESDINPEVLRQTDRIGSNMTNVGKISRSVGGIRKADSIARIIGGDPIGGGAGLIMQHPAFHKQIAKRLGKTLAKSGAKLVPGVGMTMGTLEAAGYASQGRLTQAGIAGFSALVGEIPMVGDFLSAGADLVNTGIDIATGNLGKVEMEMDDVKEFDGVPIRAARRLAKAA